MYTVFSAKNKTGRNNQKSQFSVPKTKKKPKFGQSLVTSMGELYFTFYQVTWISRSSLGFPLHLLRTRVEQGLTSHQTHYRSYQGRIL